MYRSTYLELSHPASGRARVGLTFKQDGAAMADSVGAAGSIRGCGPGSTLSSAGFQRSAFSALRSGCMSPPAPGGRDQDRRLATLSTAPQWRRRLPSGRCPSRRRISP
jgi:hypothetical protein